MTSVLKAGREVRPNGFQERTGVRTGQACLAGDATRPGSGSIRPSSPLNSKPVLRRFDLNRPRRLQFLRGWINGIPQKKKSPTYSPEVRERAVRTAFEHRAEHVSQWAAFESIAGKIGYMGPTIVQPGAAG
jgi:hypothetical protein